jgi:general secretion pathway protein D
VIVTAPTARIKDVEALIQQLDTTPMVSGDLRVIHLKFADAAVVAKIIEDMFKPKDNDNGGGRFPFIIFNPFAQQQQNKGIKINVTSDERTNTLLVTAPTEMLDVIEHVSRELDADPTTEDAFFIYHLRNGQAQHLEYTLNVLFGNITPQGGQPQQQQPQQYANQNGLGQDAFSNRTTNTSNSLSNTSSSSNRNGANNRLGGGLGGLRGLSAPLQQAINELTGKVLVVADPDTNALLVTTASKYERQVRKIIEVLDQPVPQVLIKVLIAEVTHDNSDDLGLDFSVLNTRASGNGQKIGSTFGNAAAGAANGGLVVSVLESQVQATLHALATAGKLDVLSRPYILASDNQQASITVGQIVPFVTESRLDTNNNTINTVQYRDIGIILDVTPHINPDGLVILDVEPQISSFSETTVQLSPGVNSPVFQQRAASSRVGILNGQTIVIGGMMQDQKTATLQKVPLIGDVPLLGLLFQRNQVQKTKTELLIFLTPHVAQAPQALQPMSADESRGLRLTPSAVSPGTFEDHLRGMERGSAGSTPQTQPSEPQSPVNSIDLTTPADSGEPAPGEK